MPESAYQARAIKNLPAQSIEYDNYEVFALLARCDKILLC